MEILGYKHEHCLEREHLSSIEIQKSEHLAILSRSLKKELDLCDTQEFAR